MFPDDLTFTHPFVGTDLRRQLVPLAKTSSATVLASEMRAHHLHYVFTQGTGVAYRRPVNSRLTHKVAGDRRFHYTGLKGGVHGMDVYRLSS